MTIIDANLFLYAYNADAPQQPAAAKWLSDLLASGETIGLPWVTIWAFLRLATNARIWSNPLPAEKVFGIVNDWLVLPGVIAVQPGPRHAEHLRRLVIEHNATGPLMTDAVLAALAMENGARLASTDQDFSRFKGLAWVNPLG
jgi:toxin-antitoxin system PIN domain toxin